MITILCVLKSGGVYDEMWVRKLRDGVCRNISQPHNFVCLSDIPVPCDRIPITHDWPGWWAKIGIFEPGIIKGPTLYLDLDTIVTGPLDELIDIPYDFAMLKNFSNDEMVGSGVMWFKEKAPNGVYERFMADPERIIGHYHRIRFGPYRGDQAFVFDCLNREVNMLDNPALRSYKRHCRNGLPEGTSVVCFHGRPRPTEINPPWMQEHWV